LAFRQARRLCWYSRFFGSNFVLLIATQCSIIYLVDSHVFWPEFPPHC
jgi:hypothetical protein